MSKYRWNKVVYIPLFVAVALFVGFLISRHFARQNAIQECDSFRLSAEEKPSNVQLRISTLGDIFDVLNESGARDLLYLRLPFWIVDLDGKWRLSGGPLPAEGQPDLGPQYFNHCIVFVSVFTGDTFHLQAMPIALDN